MRSWPQAVVEGSSTMAVFQLISAATGSACYTTSKHALWGWSLHSMGAPFNVPAGESILEMLASEMSRATNKVDTGALRQWYLHDRTFHVFEILAGTFWAIANFATQK
jgi:hypothetical protein